ncbi:MAG TPA: class D sortase [Povalibacter sp.]|nr:class D sortase [Povalibacter sp.]
MTTRQSRAPAARALRCLEAAAWTVGALIVTTYMGSRWWYAQARDEAVAAFDEAQGRIERSGLQIGPADMSTWSAERIERYRQAANDAGTPLALLQIPALKLVVPVFEGTSEQNLNRGAGRIEGTALPGEPGNVGIAAHRDGFFRALKDVKVGDVLLLERLGTIDTYEIVSTTIVDPSDVSVLAPTATSSVTLVTCYPFYFVGSAPKRFIVRANRTEGEKRRLPVKVRQASGSASHQGGEFSATAA